MENISSFLARLGFPLHNTRWSWGAHREGRDWRLGHNGGADGLLLRKDIHALYDAKLVSIDDRGTVMSRLDVEAHYRDYLRKS